MKPVIRFLLFMILNRKYIEYAIFIAIGLIGIYLISSNIFKVHKIDCTNLVTNNIVDIGTIGKKAESKANFIIKNPYNKNLSIVNIATDCHCTVVNCNKNKIKPGSSAIVEVMYDNHSYGYFEQTIEISIDECSFPIQLIFRGIVTKTE